MKPSELKAGRMREADKPIPTNISRDADPPISVNETENAPAAICRWHGGLIQRFTNPADYGKVFYCPEGEQYWRFPDPKREVQRWGKKLRPIRYRNDGIV